MLSLKILIPRVFLAFEINTMVNHISISIEFACGYHDKRLKLCILAK